MKFIKKESGGIAATGGLIALLGTMLVMTGCASTDRDESILDACAPAGKVVAIDDDIVVCEPKVGDGPQFIREAEDES